MKKIRLGLITILVPLFAAEIALRIWFPIERIRTFPGSDNNPLGWGPDVAPVCEALPEEIPQEKGRRVMLIGDSILNCFDHKDARFKVPGVLKSMLGPHKIDVLNLSSGAWGTDQELLAYERVGRLYKPSLVLLFFTSVNDLHNNVSRLGNSPPTPKPRFILNDDGKLTLIPAEAKPPISVTRRWLSETQIGLRIFSMIDEKQVAFPDPFINPQVAAFAVPPPPWIETSWKLTEVLLRELRDRVTQDGAKFGIVYVPGGLHARDAGCAEKTCYGYGSERITLDCGGRSRTYDLLAPFERLTDVANRLKIPLIHNLDEMTFYRNQHRQVCYDCLHLTEAGSYMLANRVADYLKDHSLEYFAGESIATNRSLRPGTRR